MEPTGKTYDIDSFEKLLNHFLWTDDGKNQINGITIKNNVTGEVTRINIREQS